LSIEQFATIFLLIFVAEIKKIYFFTNFFFGICKKSFFKISAINEKDDIL